MAAHPREPPEQSDRWRNPDVSHGSTLNSLTLITGKDAHLCTYLYTYVHTPTWSVFAKAFSCAWPLFSWKSLLIDAKTVRDET